MENYEIKIQTLARRDEIRIIMVVCPTAATIRATFGADGYEYIEDTSGPRAWAHYPGEMTVFSGGDGPIWSVEVGAEMSRSEFDSMMQVAARGKARLESIIRANAWDLTPETHII